MLVRLAQLALPEGLSWQGQTDRVVRHLLCLPPCDVLVLPELWQIGYFDYGQYLLAALAGSGDSLCRVARTLMTSARFVHAGSTVAALPHGRFVNRAIMAASGEILDHYDKRHLFDREGEESQILSAGEVMTTIAIGPHHAVVITCYDLRFLHEWTDLLATADLLVITAAWPQQRRIDWIDLLYAAARTYRVTVIAVNGAGPSGPSRLALAGTSMCITSDGTAVIMAGADEEVLDICL
ncbi:nitrilase-related carbon-nitrogen hydrolase [Nocardia sp. R16R-3T]